VASTGNDRALHVVGERLERVPDRFTQLSAPLMARTGIVSGRLLRCSFCVIIASHSR
jgi:hypothetical protein